MLAVSTHQGENGTIWIVAGDDGPIDSTRDSRQARVWRIWCEILNTLASKAIDRELEVRYLEEMVSERDDPAAKPPGCGGNASEATTSTTVRGGQRADYLLGRRSREG